MTQTDGSDAYKADYAKIVALKKEYQPDFLAFFDIMMMITWMSFVCLFFGF